MTLIYVIEGITAVFTGLIALYLRDILKHLERKDK
jgi:hypothetical protein